jgi:hydroxymethylpyrimidine kinase/phosphomethylpyrimidine kinase
VDLPLAPPVALTIAGSDPSGGAGIQADLKTFGACAVYGAAVITALTAQNTSGVAAVHVPPADFVAQQIELVLDDLPVAAVKTGMLARRDIAERTAEILRARAVPRLVVDPVMVSKSGARLLDEGAIDALREALLPLAAVATPNLPEAAVLLGASEAEVARDPERAARALLALGPRAVVLKGGHRGGAASDDLYADAHGLVVLPAARIETTNTHGTGCTFAAALAAHLARGATPAFAARAAKEYVTAALRAARAWRLGRGHGPVHHFHAWWSGAD